MTVSSTTTKNSYSGNGSTTTFAYGFKIFADADLTVILRSSTGVETVQSLTTHYTVTNAGNASGGNVVFGSAPASGVTVVIRRNMALTQSTDYVANDPFPAATHEDALDRLTFISQQMQEEVDRTIKLSRTNTMTSTEFTVGATDRASKVLAFDSSGELSVTQELGTFKGSDATVTTAAYVERDIIKSTTTAELNNVYICVAASVVGDSLTDTDHFALLVDAVSAASSATTATTKASEAATSATNAANSASTASTQASNASTSASTASTQATNAANSATAAASSAASAATALDNFDDIFLGAKSSDPSTDNDGDALNAGDLYFNTTDNVLKVFNGSSFQSIDTLTTGISSGNVPVFTSGVADDDFLRVNGTSIEGRSASEVLSDIGASAVAGSSSIVTTGALNSGSITSGFGNIDTGSSTITTTGLITGGSLDIDDVLINGSTIGHTDDTDLITVSNGTVTVAGEISVTTLDIGGTNVTSTATELNQLDGKVAKTAGKESIWIPAAAMYPNTTNGCSALTQVELSNGPEIKVLDFDASSDENAQFSIAFPKSWNEGTITFQAFFTVTGTNTGTVAWGLSGTAIADNDSCNTAFGTNVVATAKAHSGTSNDLNVSAESGAVTIAGSPSTDELVFFQVMRDVSADDQSGDARLLGLKILFTTDAANDV